MKNNLLYGTFVTTLALCAGAFALAGCASTEGKSNSAPTTAVSSGPAIAGPFKFQADDGRTIEIGKASAAEGGRRFKNPHLEKCWIVDGFKFAGYDTLYIAPTKSTAKFNKDEERPHQLAMENIVLELERSLRGKGIFGTIVTRESDIKAGARVLKLENTITEYSKGGGAARFWVGLYGGGQPGLRVSGQMMDGGRLMFAYEARRSGVSAGARMSGAFMKDEDIQLEDIRSMSLDLTDFVAAVAGKYQAKE